ncbi:MAG: AAA family ATPase, partial [Deltaproteobacteria bacterium]|nr:AAA family ATPase [Deltaproteobacteria bacterium]
MKKLPVSIQTFKKITEGGYVYADKTKYVYDLARDEGAYFLSRPRRFGKSLLLSTFEALFSGAPDPDGPPQGLFADLWIGRELDYDFRQKYPVITLNMNLNSRTPNDLENALKDMLQTIVETHSLKITGSSPGGMLDNLITKLYKKHGTGVVVLIDEYDSPVSDNIDNFDLAETNSVILKNFYSNLKSCDKYLRFVFVTGVTRCAFMGLSAGLNHLADLTIDAKHAGICGFTRQELEDCFSDLLPELLRRMQDVGNMPHGATLEDMWREIGLWYDGYSWDGKTRLYNPYSLINLFLGDSFEPFWMNLDPSAKMLSEILANDPLAVTRDRFKDISTEEIGLAEVGSLGPVPALFQTGMLTIDKITYAANRSKLFTLRLPNEEVTPKFYAKFSSRLNEYFKTSPKSKKIDFYGIIKDKNAADLSILINSIFGSIPA